MKNAPEHHYFLKGASCLQLKIVKTNRTRMKNKINSLKIYKKPQTSALFGKKSLLSGLRNSVIMATPF